MSIVTTLGQNNLKINDDILNTMIKYKQLRPSDLEGGGILIARQCVDTDNIIIEHLTTPLAGDIRTRTRYKRKDQGHINYFKQLFEDNNGIYGYMGEWHTHPEEIPSHSCLDFSNWNMIAKGNDRDMIYCHIILGMKNICIWAFSNGKADRIFTEEI